MTKWLGTGNAGESPWPEGGTGGDQGLDAHRQKTAAASRGALDGKRFNQRRVGDIRSASRFSPGRGAGYVGQRWIDPSEERLGGEHAWQRVEVSHHVVVR